MDKSTSYPGYILQSKIVSRKSVIHFTEELINYLFPAIADKNSFLNNHAQYQQILREELTGILSLVCGDKEQEKVASLVESFFSALKGVKDKLLKDAFLTVQFDPAATSVEEVILSYPGFKAILVYRLANVLYLLRVPLVPRVISEWVHGITGIDIHPGASIGCPFLIDHGTGVVIGETAVIGNNVKIYQGVTLGALAVRKEDAKIKRHPSVEDNVIIYAGSTILGGNTVIGHDCIIGGNTWITESILPYSIVYHKNQTLISDRRQFEEPINFVI